jgi:hypothetical protein
LRLIKKQSATLLTKLFFYSQYLLGVGKGSLQLIKLIYFMPWII